MVLRKDVRSALKELKNPRLPWEERATLRRRIADDAGNLVPELTRVLKRSKSIGFRNELLSIIGSSGEQAFEEPLRRLVEDADVPVEIRQTAATNLGKLRSRGSFALLTNLLGDPTPHVRLGAIYGLEALGDARAVPHLTELLNDETSVKAWWPGPKAGGYVIAREAAEAIDKLKSKTEGGDLSPP